jgi:hypothetical protein
MWLMIKFSNQSLEVQDVYLAAAWTDPNVIYYHEAMVAHNKEQFVHAMEQVIIGQSKKQIGN